MNTTENKMNETTNTNLDLLGCDFKITPTELKNMIDYFGGKFLFYSDGVSMMGTQYNGKSETNEHQWSWIYTVNEVIDIALDLQSGKDGYIKIQENSTDHWWQAGTTNEDLDAEDFQNIYFCPAIEETMNQEEMLRASKLFFDKDYIKFKATLKGIDTLLRSGDFSNVKIDGEPVDVLTASDIVDDTLILYTEQGDPIKITINATDNMANVAISISDEYICDTGNHKIVIPVAVHKQVADKKPVLTVLH